MNQDAWTKGGSKFAANYISSQMEGNGYATVTKMKFPRPNGPKPGPTKSIYGMWGANDLGNC